MVALSNMPKGTRYWGVYSFEDYFKRRYVAVFADLADAENFALSPDWPTGPNGLYVGPMRRKN
jgi:hypothetical protein